MLQPQFEVVICIQNSGNFLFSLREVKKYLLGLKWRAPPLHTRNYPALSEGAAQTTSRPNHRDQLPCPHHTPIFYLLRLKMCSSTVLTWAAKLSSELTPPPRAVVTKPLPLLPVVGELTQVIALTMDDAGGSRRHCLQLLLPDSGQLHVPPASPHADGKAQASPRCSQEGENAKRTHGQNTLAKQLSHHQTFCPKTGPITPKYIYLFAQGDVTHAVCGLLTIHYHSWVLPGAGQSLQKWPQSRGWSSRRGRRICFSQTKEVEGLRAAGCEGFQVKHVRVSTWSDLGRKNFLWNFKRVKCSKHKQNISPFFQRGRNVFSPLSERFPFT